MRILHCCLANFYIDDYGYQENILTKMHKLQGHQVAIIASTETYLNNAAIGYLEPMTYYTKSGIEITRVRYSKILPHFIMRKLRIYRGLKKPLHTFGPDIIFLHGCQFLSIKTIVSYVKKNPNIRVYIDGHTDFINSANNLISKCILHKYVYRWCAKKIEPYTKKFYGVLPIRMKFFRDMYNISAEKISFLPLGADDSVFDLSKKNVIREFIRKKLDIDNSDFVIVTGGKIDKRKKIHTLINVITEINHHRIKLIVFGVPDNQMKKEIQNITNHETIRYVGWTPYEKTYDYFLSSDLAFFPGTHSVLWEQAVGTGLPCVFRRWVDMQHVDVGGNCLFIDTADEKEIKKVILNVYFDKYLFLKMKHVAIEKAITKFTYSDIAKKAIEE